MSERKRYGECTRKVAYDKPEIAEHFARTENGKVAGIYKCRFCDWYHITTHAVRCPKPGTFRVILTAYYEGF